MCALNSKKIWKVIDVGIWYRKIWTFAKEIICLLTALGRPASYEISDNISGTDKNIHHLIHKWSECILWQTKANGSHFSNSLNQRNKHMSTWSHIDKTHTELYTPNWKSHITSHLYSWYHFVPPGVHCFLPLRKALGYDRLRIELLQ